VSPKIRETLYYLGAIIPGVVGIALVWGGIEQGSATAIGDVLVGLLTLLGATAPAVAAKKVNEQRKDGTFETPEPVEVVVNGVQAVIEAQQKAQAELDRVKNAVTGVVGAIPELGPLASQLINSVPTTLGQAYSQWNDLTEFQRPEYR
jgi:hypothetical protein